MADGARIIVEDEALRKNFHRLRLDFDKPRGNPAWVKRYFRYKRKLLMEPFNKKAGLHPQTGQRVKWRALSYRYALQKQGLTPKQAESKNIRPNRVPTLHKTGALKAAVSVGFPKDRRAQKIKQLVLKASKRGVKEYAWVHMFGSRKTGVPARPYMEWTQCDTDELAKVLAEEAAKILGGR